MVNDLTPLSRATIATLLFLSFGAGCKKAVENTLQPEVIVQAVHPVVDSITEDIVADAVLYPVAQAAILPKVSAPVRKFYVQRGARVVAGQLLATLENRDLEAAAIDTGGAYDAAKGTFITSAQTTVLDEQTKARTDLDQAKAALDLQKAILKSREQLLSEGAIPGRDVDTARAATVQAQAAYDVAQQHASTILKTGTAAALESAKGQLTSAHGKYLGAEAQLSYTSIRTPISGVVTERPLFAGETAAVGTPIVTVMDTSTVIAKLHLAQAQAQRLKVEAGATLTVPGIDAPVRAKVALVSPALDPGSATVEVWLKAANPDGKLKPGTSVQASIRGNRVDRALLVPTDAVQRSSEAAGRIVLVIGADGKTRKRNVTVGMQTKESVQIVEGLSKDDLVITGGGVGLEDGTKVKIGPPEKKDDDEKSASSANDEAGKG